MGTSLARAGGAEPGECRALPAGGAACTGSERNCVLGAVLLRGPREEEEQLQPQYLELLVQDELRGPAEEFIRAQAGPVSPLHLPDGGKEL